MHFCFLALKKGKMSTFNHALALVADSSAATLPLEPIFEDVRIVAYEKMCLSPVAHITHNARVSDTDAVHHCMCHLGSGGQGQAVVRQ